MRDDGCGATRCGVAQASCLPLRLEAEATLLRLPAARPFKVPLYWRALLRQHRSASREGDREPTCGRHRASMRSYI
jgi:hypothetical protein